MITIGTKVHCLYGQREYADGVVIAINGDRATVRPTQLYTRDMIACGGAQYARDVKVLLSDLQGHVLP